MNYNIKQPIFFNRLAMGTAFSMWTLRFTSSPVRRERRATSANYSGRHWGRGGVCKKIHAPKRLSPVSGDVTRAARVGSSWLAERRSDRVRENDENREKCVWERGREREREREGGREGGKQEPSVSSIWLSYYWILLLLLFGGVVLFISFILYFFAHIRPQVSCGVNLFSFFYLLASTPLILILVLHSLHGTTDMSISFDFWSFF